MRTLLVLSLLFLSSCSSIPIEELSNLTPSECRSYGVEVEDGRPITGTIVRSEFGLSHTLEKECGGFSVGCTKAVDQIDSSWKSPTQRYEIWYSGTKCIPEHEACHALYEKDQHTVSFFIQQAQYDRFAGCPK